MKLTPLLCFHHLDIFMDLYPPVPIITLRLNLNHLSRSVYAGIHRRAVDSRQITDVNQYGVRIRRRDLKKVAVSIYPFVSQTGLKGRSQPIDSLGNKRLSTFGSLLRGLTIKQYGDDRGQCRYRDVFHSILPSV